MNKKLAAEKAAEVFITNHPGHASQKVHGRKGGGGVKGNRAATSGAVIDAMGGDPTNEDGNTMEWKGGGSGADRLSSFRASMQKKGYKLDGSGVKKERNGTMETTKLRLTHPKSGNTALVRLHTKSVQERLPGEGGQKTTTTHSIIVDMG